jgi:hypothetical protein
MDLITVGIAVGAVLLLFVLWILWKFSIRLLKFAVLALLIVGIGVGAYWYRMRPPPKPAGIGKHAYLSATGKYLGVVEGQGDDRSRGEVWIVRLPGSHPAMYSKSRVALKDKRDLASEPTPEPTATLSATARPAAKQTRGKP